MTDAKRKTTKRAAASVARAPKAPDIWPKFSRETALRFLDEIEEKFNDITSVAIAGQEYQETRSDDHRDVVMCSLLRIIQQQGGDVSTFHGKELRKMLEALPEGGGSWPLS